MKTVAVHFRILAAICVASWIMLYIMGHFLVLHPDAYKDMTRSIIIVYAIVLLSIGAWRLLARFLPAQFAPDRISTLANGYTPFQLIAALFLVITVVNSVMMLTGIDAPKQGVFTYVHMLTRLMIVTFSIVAWKWHETLTQLKAFHLVKSALSLLRGAHKQPLATGAQIFTLATVAYCLTAIAASYLIPVSGGAFFYRALLGIMAASLALPAILKGTKA